MFIKDVDHDGKNDLDFRPCGKLCSLRMRVKTGKMIFLTSLTSKGRQGSLIMLVFYLSRRFTLFLGVKKGSSKPLNH